MRRFGPALLVGVVAFALYRATLLPGLDLGDTGSFHATAGSPVITPRDVYPLYFALGDLTLLATGAEPAHAFNLASAIEGGIAAAVLAIAAAELSGSVIAGAAAALLFAGAYTFWSQAIIAEVYALHAVFVSLTLYLLLRWARKPTIGRLTLFFAVYALGFGDHLSMILLLPGYTLFLFLSAPRWRDMLSPRVIAIAAACAAAGALQYTWNLHALWLRPFPPHDLREALQIFWFDVTKTDWRESMVMQVPTSTIANRLAMYWFDVRQQFGVAGVGLGALGIVELASTAWRRAALMVVLYVVNFLFAFTYNVGDTHVFYLPSHLLIAALSSCGIALVARAIRRAGAVPIFASVLALYAAVRIYRDYPALDRSRDDRPTEVLARLTRGLDDRTDILLTDLNWQLDNGLSYFVKRHPEIADARMPDVLPYLPALVRDNAAGGRHVTVTERAEAEANAAYGPLFVVDRDRRVTAPRLQEEIDAITPATRYVMIVLKPTREYTMDSSEFSAAVSRLSGGRVARLPRADYFAMAGLAGDAPVLLQEENSPFTVKVSVGRTPVDVRMDAWLAADTIRRMGFAHAIAARQHTLIAERGVSLATFREDGVPLTTIYAEGIFAPQRRYLISLAE